MIEQHILSLNVGSSSLKLALFDRRELERVLSGSIDQLGKPDALLSMVEVRTKAKTEHKLDGGSVTEVLPELDQLLKRRSGGQIAAIAHRVVHGGPEFTDHAAITPDMLDKLARFEALAPNHLPIEITFMRKSLEQFPGIPQIACFDTVFHRDLPDVAKTLPLPAHVAGADLRKYGFHGLSYTYLMRRLPELVGEAKADGRVVLAHLGSGASMAAVRHGKSVDTTMGLTPLGGLVMATRTGDIDPGIPYYLNKMHGTSPADFQHMACKDSGMLGISGRTGDVRDLLKQENTDAGAALALEIFCHEARKHAAAMAASLQGIDILVMSGGIGANAPAIRQRICEDLDWMGIAFDPVANAAGELCISAPHSRVMVFAIPTDEEQAMAGIVASRIPFPSA
jgi:acetate kinase